MQEWSPLLVFFQVFSDMLGQKNVSGIPAIHHSLGHIDATPATFVRSFTSTTPLTGPL
jgi:hypothetical protein